MGRRPERGVTRPGEPARMPAAGRVCGQEHGPSWCQDAVFARGMCRRHYRRVAKGLPADTNGGRQVGVTPSGRGIWGVLTTAADGRLLCHECGRWYVALGVHIGMVHGSVREYRLTHGLLMSQPLAATGLSTRLAAATRGNGGTERIAAHRRTDIADRIDPALARRGQRLRRDQGRR